MIKILSCFLLILLGLESKVKIAVSIEPQDFFVQKIGGELVETYVIVPSARNPENYEPSLSQMNFLKDTKVYFGIGMDFEAKWKDRFLSANKNMNFIDLSHLIEHNHHDHHMHEKHDRHIWLSVVFASKQAQKIYEILSELDSENKHYYKENLETFLREISELDLKIKNIFASKTAQREFLVFHPAFEYFSQEYGLVEWAIDEHNKEAKIKHMQKINNIIRQKALKVIYVQPQFSTKQVELLAKQHQLKISTLDPFVFQWDKNLLDMAEKIANEK